MIRKFYINSTNLLKTITMKRVILGVLLFLCATSLISAQDKKIDCEAYIGASLLRGSDNLGNGANLNVNFTCDYYVQKNLGIGIGIGLEFYQTKDYIPNNYSFKSIPIFAEVKYKVPINEKVAFVSLMDAGILFNDVISSNNFHAGRLSAKTSAYLSPQVGFRFRISEHNLSLNVRAAYKRFCALDANMFGLIFGIGF
jgi:hypothetical protein